MDGESDDNVIIIQHQNDGLIVLADVVDEQRQDCFGGWRLGGLQGVFGRLAQAGNGRLQGSRQISQETYRIVVTFIE